MLFGRQSSRVLVYDNPVDMRKSFDGLLSVASQGISEDVLSGSLFLFVNRSKTILKVLFWDRTGWCVVAKRLCNITTMNVESLSREELIIAVMQRDAKVARHQQNITQHHHTTTQ